MSDAREETFDVNVENGIFEDPIQRTAKETGQTGPDAPQDAEEQSSVAVNRKPVGVDTINKSVAF